MPVHPPKLFVSVAIVFCGMLASGCVGAVAGAAVGATTAVAVGTVKGVGAVATTTVKTTGKVVGAAIPDNDDD